MRKIVDIEIGKIRSLGVNGSIVRSFDFYLTPSLTPTSMQIMHVAQEK